MMSDAGAAAPAEDIEVLLAAETARRHEETATLVASRIVAASDIRAAALGDINKWQEQFSGSPPSVTKTRLAAVQLRDLMRLDRKLMVVTGDVTPTYGEGGVSYPVEAVDPARPDRLQGIEAAARTIAGANLGILVRLALRRLPDLATSTSNPVVELRNIVRTQRLYDRAAQLGGHNATDDLRAAITTIRAAVLDKLHNPKRRTRLLDPGLLEPGCLHPDELVWRTETWFWPAVLGRTELGRDDETTVDAMRAVAAARQTVALAARYLVFHMPEDVLDATQAVHATPLRRGRASQESTVKPSS